LVKYIASSNVKKTSVKSRYSDWI